MRGRRLATPAIGSDDRGNHTARFLAAMASAADEAAGVDLSAVVRATGLSWGVASSLAARLRRGGQLARLPHGRLILSARGRAEARLA